MDRAAALVVVLAAFLGSVSPSLGLDNGLAQTPPMGFANWNGFGCNINASGFRAQADAMAAHGFLDAGYNLVVIQECISKERSANGTIIVDPAKFPEGMPHLVDYIHSKGLKAGIYTDVGPETCAGYVGSFNHEKQDAATFAAWGIDFVEEDSCHHPTYPNGTVIPYHLLYARMRDALNATGRPMVFYSCVQGQDDVYQWGPATANLWRTTSDICAPNKATWGGVLHNFRGNALYPNVTGPGQWQDPDMLVVGMAGLSPMEWRTHFSLWVMSAAPLWIGIDIPSMPSAARDIFLNREAIAIDQDPLGIMATQRQVNGGSAPGECWARPLQPAASGKWRAAALLFNPDDSRSVSVSVSAAALGVPPSVVRGGGSVRVRDVWTNASSTLGGALTSRTLAPHDGVLLLLEEL